MSNTKYHESQYGTVLDNPYQNDSEICRGKSCSIIIYFCLLL